MKDIRVITNFPIAADSPDHLMPYGTRMGSSRDPIFRRKLHLLWPGKILRILDLGCGGGAFVRELIDDGDIAIGLEGSDWSQKMQREAWPIISKFLFICDITKPFEIMEGNIKMKFDVITAWEVMEHIKTSDIEHVLKNVRNHLDEQGLFVVSIDTEEDVMNGVTLHQTAKPESWWTQKFRELGFHNLSHLHNFFGKHFNFLQVPPSFNLVVSANPSLAPKIPKERLRKKIFEVWARSKPQKILKRIVNGEPN